MTDKPMMVCGHAANAVQTIEDERLPSCAICGTNVQVPSPDLTGRRARCSYRHDNEADVAPSSSGLPFFEYLGPGSAHATDTCGRCRYHAVAHGAVNVVTGRPGITDHTFTPAGPAEFDRYYCGCRGWD